MMEYDEGEEMFPLQTCEHVFHTDCIRQYFESQVNDSLFPLKCPDVNCKMPCCEDDIGSILTKDMYTKFHKRTLNLAIDKEADMSWCPTPGCSYGFVFEDGDKEFKCPSCNKHYCLDCRAPFHIGQTCQEYKINNTHSKEDEQFLKFVKGKKMKQCPQCKFWV